MHLKRTKTELQGKLSEVVETIAVAYPDIAKMTEEVVGCMLATNVDKMEFTNEIYERIQEVNIKLSTDGDKVFIEILRGESSD